MSDYPKKYWQSPEERDGDPAWAESQKDEFPEPLSLMEKMDELKMSRADFLKLAGLGAAGVVMAGCESKARPLIPYLVQPEEVVPGQATWYATTCGGCSASCGVLARNREGRPVKLEGNPVQPVSSGALCAAGQAAIMELYDPRRLKGPRIHALDSDWAGLDADIGSRLVPLKGSAKAVRFLTRTLTSPFLRARIAAFLKPFPNSRHVMVDALSCSAILAAHQATHGRRLLPHYRFDRARLMVSLDADFLGTWISPVEFARAYQVVRDPSHPETYATHVQVESRFSTTGAKADLRWLVRPSQMKLVLAHLAHRVARGPVPKALRGLPASSLPSGDLDRLAESLRAHREESLVVCGVNDEGCQRLVNFINLSLHNYGRTLEVDRPSLQKMGDDDAMGELASELEAGQVEALFVLDANPVYDWPQGSRLGQAIRRIPLSVSLSCFEDETSSACRFSCPDHHWLESWGDAEPWLGTLSLVQPTIQPLYKTRAAVESLTSWSDEPAPAGGLLKDYWKSAVFPASAGQDFQVFWGKALEEGTVSIPGRFHLRASRRLPEALHFEATRADGLELLLYPKTVVGEGRQANNAWLQEAPDPISKEAWDQCAAFSPKRADRLGLKNGDLVALRLEQTGPEMELPALIQPGQQDDCVAVPLSYGRLGSEALQGLGPSWLLHRPASKTGNLLGVNPSPFKRLEGNQVLLHAAGLTVMKTGHRQELSLTQTHHSLFVPARLAPAAGAKREVIREVSLVSPSLPPEAPLESLYPEMPYPGRRWGMAIDLNACNGCSACVVACQIENNVPLVGADEVRRGREMHWLRIDRYYSERDGSEEDGHVEAAFQPMLCQHCGDAPCEPVCPTAASLHSSEGLNQQVYNRCVGTRYCENNCPYKVRRFNWFDYAHGQGLQAMGLNPDVATRSRGVMEKCTFCVQRIEEGKAGAKRQARGLKDGDVVTACQQACPARAIVFGDMNDPESRVSQQMKDPRAYKVLEELNVRPGIAYLAVVKNRGPL
jgi:molybdopterin-containing oxidoreductase family iron-sulfur binding subunit